MSVSACCLYPGFHDPRLTVSFVRDLWGDRPPEVAIFPADRWPVYSPHHAARFLAERAGERPVAIAAFSAGVVGAIAAARARSRAGLPVAAFLAFDGWGVPLAGDFPLYRLSHDRFTRDSSVWLGGGARSFYADPPVAHLDLWRSPRSARGWELAGDRRIRYADAAACARAWLAGD